MTLNDLALPMDRNECMNLALVYSHGVAVSLYQLQEQHGDWRHVCLGRPLVDGRWMIDGEILSMIGPGGLYAWIGHHMDADVMGNIEVVPLADAEDLLMPPDPPIDE
jgi:hypothetical protein